MNFLEERILKDGTVKEGNVLKVDSFLNHQIDVSLLDRIGEEFYNRFKDRNITKILTIESSGIGIACFVAKYFNVPVLFAKKSKSVNIDGDMYVAEVESFTHKCRNQVIVSKRFINEGDGILIIDDFLANGQALFALKEITEKSGAELIGASTAIEKGFQGGGDKLREIGVDLYSLAIIDQMENGKIVFRKA
jgi:xanthine phosphoribosyltransferase